MKPISEVIKKLESEKKIDKDDNSKEEILTKEDKKKEVEESSKDKSVKKSLDDSMVDYLSRGK